MAATSVLNSSASTHSTASALPRVKMTFRQFLQKNKQRFFGFVAPWYTLTHFVMKTLQLLLSIVCIVLLFVWESQGVKITTLNQDEYNYRNNLFFFVGVVSLSILYAFIMTILGCAGAQLPSKARTFFAGLCVLAWLLANPIMSATLDTLEDSVFSRIRNLDTFYLRTVSVIGFVLMLIFVVDILVGFTALRLSDNKALDKLDQLEMKNSRTVVAAVRLTSQQSSRRLRTHSS